MSTEEFVIIWEAPKIIPPEFRLYYDEKGRVICYTCEKLEGKYIVIDKDIYAQGRPDVRVIDGKLVKSYDSVVISKLELDPNEGIATALEDVSIVVDKKYKGKSSKWKLKVYEL